MASNVTVQSVLGKISQDHLECSICSDRFKEPKVLDCLHSFCLKCLKELRQHQEGTGLTCPLCRCETILKGNGVADLPNNFTLGALLEEFTMQEQLLEGQGSEVTCQACDELNQAVSRCMDCDSFLCPECQRAHGRLSMMKSHKVCTLAELQAGTTAYKSKLRDVPKCTNHPDQNLNTYCNTCKNLMCTTCSVLHDEKHSFTDLPEALSKCKQVILKLIAKVEKNKEELTKANMEVEKTRETLDSMFADAKDKISKKADQDIAKIREEEQILKQVAKKIYEERAKTLDTAYAANSQEVTKTENKLDDVNRLLAQGSCHEILDLKQKLLNNLQELTGKQPFVVSNDMSFYFQEGEKSLGQMVQDFKPKSELQAQAKEPPTPEQLHRKKPWQLKTTRSRFKSATDVAVFSNNEIIVADASDDHQQLKTFFPISKHMCRGSFTSQALHIKGVNNPCQVAVNRHDHLTVVDGITVKTFNRKYQLLHHFNPGGVSDSELTCLAVDSNLIALGFEHRQEISLHKQDGTLIKRLPAPGIGDYLTIYKQRLIYTNLKDKKLQSVDHNGRVVFSTEISGDANQHCDLQGMCCDNDGNIYVAAFRDDDTDEIHQFSPDGRHLGRVIKGCDSVYGIALSPSCEILAVAAECSVKIYCHP